MTTPAATRWSASSARPQVANGRPKSVGTDSATFLTTTGFGNDHGTGAALSPRAKRSPERVGDEGSREPLRPEDGPIDETVGVDGPHSDAFLGAEMKRMVLVACLAGLLAFASVALADESRGDRQGQDGNSHSRDQGGGKSEGNGGAPSSFSGSCQIQGDILYPGAPLKTAPQRLAIIIRAQGSCTGSLNGKTLTNAPILLRTERRDVTFSCSPGGMLANIPGRIVFREGGQKIAFRLSLVSAALASSLRLDGARSGGASGTVEAMPPPDAAVRCMNQGLRDVQFSAQFSTVPDGQISG